MSRIKWGNRLINWRRLRIGIGMQIWLLVMLPVAALMAMIHHINWESEAVYVNSHDALEKAYERSQEAQAKTRDIRRSVFHTADVLQKTYQMGQYLLLAQENPENSTAFLATLDKLQQIVDANEVELKAYIQYLRELGVVLSDEFVQAHLRSLGEFPQALTSEVDMWLKANVLLRNASNLKRYIENYRQSAEYTLSLLEKGQKQQAINDFIFEGRPQVEWLNNAFMKELSLIRNVETGLERALKKEHDDIVDYWQAVKRDQNQHTQELVWVGGGLVLICAALYALLGVARPLIRLSRAMIQSAEGKTITQSPSLNRSDEIGAMWRALKIFVGVLEDNVQSNVALKQSIDDNYRLLQIIEQNRTAMIMSDDAGKLWYINKKAELLFKELRDSLKAQWPAFNDRSVLENSMLSLMALGEGGKRFTDLSEVTKPHGIEVVFGERTFRIFFAPVLDEAGKTIGVGCQWLERTEQLSTETDIDQLLGAVSQGDLTVRVSLEGKTGFYQRLSEGLNRFADLSEQIFSETRNVMAGLADGDLTQRMRGDYQGIFAELRQSTNETVKQLQSVLDTIKSESNTLSHQAHRIALHNEEINDRTNAQAAALEQAAASVQMLADTATNNAEQAAKAKGQADDAFQHASQGGEVVQRSIVSMGEISASSDRVGSITSTINEIAFQTSLLSLNASVEAARAGDEGRGFAVVAGEVRNLALRCSNSAKEISQLIEDSANKILDGQSLAAQSGEVLETIQSTVAVINDSLQLISQTSVDQSHSVAQINETIQALGRSTQDNGQLVASVSESTKHLSAQAKRLDQQVSFFSA